MPFIHGRSTYFKLGTVDLSAYMDNTDHPHTADVHDTTTYGKSYRTRAPGLKNTSFSIGGLYDTTATTGLEATMRAMVGTTQTYEFGPEGNTTGKVKHSGSVVVAAFNTSSPVADMVRWTADLQGSDTMTTGAYV